MNARVRGCRSLAMAGDALTIWRWSCACQRSEPVARSNAASIEPDAQSTVELRGSIAGPESDMSDALYEMGAHQRAAPVLRLKHQSRYWRNGPPGGLTRPMANTESDVAARVAWPTNVIVFPSASVLRVQIGLASDGGGASDVLARAEPPPSPAQEPA